MQVYLTRCAYPLAGGSYRSVCLPTYIVSHNRVYRAENGMELLHSYDADEAGLRVSSTRWVSQVALVITLEEGGGQGQGPVPDQ